MALPHLPEISAGADRIEYGTSACEHNFEVEDPAPTLSVRWIHKDHGEYIIHTHLTGVYNLGNVAAAVVVGSYFGVQSGDIVTAISSYQPSNNRSQLANTERNKLILDAYNANPNSMEAAVINLKEVAGMEGLAILGAMKELGDHTAEEHQKLIETVEQLKLNATFIGDEFCAFKGAYPAFKFFATTDEAYAYYKQNKISGRTVLLKGSRSMRLESLQELF